MQEIKCPNCGEIFAVDESGYAQIVRQVRDKEFEKEIRQREKDLEQIRDGELKLARMEQKQEFDRALSAKDAELFERDKTIEQLRERLSGSETQKELAISRAVQEKERELTGKAAEIAELKNRLSNKAAESELREQSLRKQYEDQLRQKDELIGYYKDFKARQSTKMIGESLEQHCLNQFNSLRMTAFPAAYFEKDNDVRTGSKGDFIFRESAEGTEFISIMFEMKNEMDETATKHKNEDFLKELDRDRREKKCEYAVLVSLLEIDNEYYNNGIVDVSYKYEKMYVIRPQFFIPIITLLRNAALGSLTYRRQLEAVRHQQLDILQFEENMNTFKEGFARNYRLASDKFKKAVDEIDKTISSLQKMKDYLLSSENNLRLANNKAEELSIKKLTKGAPAVKEMFDNLKNEGAEKGEGTYERDSQD
ncbi:MAG: DUF2130 domain-containing protein [Lachnospiraceae bacterium]|jgi:hypothetical protein|nr:DUF2130 domain-containing protein [Lachnospiraceae bacterium]